MTGLDRAGFDRALKLFSIMYGTVPAVYLLLLLLLLLLVYDDVPVLYSKYDVRQQLRSYSTTYMYTHQRAASN